jgi:hypothetical protein
LLDEDAFPIPVELGEVLSPHPDAPENSAGRTYYSKSGLANMNVFIFRHAWQASLEFRSRQKQPRFSNPDSLRPEEDWYIPSNLKGFLSGADEYDIVCGGLEAVPMCVFIARFDYYYIYFNVHTVPGGVSHEDVEDLLSTIEIKMLTCLNQSEG